MQTTIRTYNSTAIEGNPLTLQETRIVLLDGLTIGGLFLKKSLMQKTMLFG